MTNIPNIDSLDTPVLFIGFNRPETSKKVFEAIRGIRPAKLYVALDGPRPDKPGEDGLCEEVKGIFENIDWDCELKTLFRQENVGCKLGVVGAIDWLFENEEKGIILEDDCVPSKSFFHFCDELLDRYMHDTRVMHIAGYNHRPDYVRDPDYSYYFSYYGYMWGWATWRRAWNLYDVNLSNFEEVIKKNYLDGILPGKLATKYYIKKVRDAYTGVNDTWDYQWDFIRMTNSGLSIVPHNNLIHNIGFGEDATHTVSSANWSMNNIASELEFPLQHPHFVLCDTKSDRVYFNQLMKWTAYRKVMGLVGVKGFSTQG